eukprot:TRINITY_DN7468_c0_g2_i1.p1 TRINITY_DN7468_c0_g2~~TRINITY_DN7468_c0_g2_i1.p1  ORF type:complete len:1229 (+),score=555.07 TRINITY_DN7468_c0_g2_i1:65-3688(+)
MGDDEAEYVTMCKAEPDRLPQDVITDKFREFVQGYGDKLEGSEKLMDEAVGEVWDMGDPIALSFAPDTKHTIEEVLGQKAKADQLFYKVMMATSSLVAEVGDLVDEAKTRLIPALTLFGEKPTEAEQEDGEVQLEFGRCLPVLLDTWTFCDRAYKVIENIIQQLASLYNDKNRKRTDRKGLAAYQYSHLTTVWMSIVDLMSILMGFDQIILQNASFHPALTVYKRMMKNARNQPEKFNVDAQQAKRVGFLLEKIETDLLDDQIFQRLLDERPFEDPEGMISVRDNLMFMTEFNFQMREIFTFIKRGHGTSNEVDRRGMYVGLCGLFKMYYQFYRDKIKNDDKKFFKSLFDVHKEVPVIHIAGNITFAPAEWLGRKLPELSNSVCRDPNREHLSACKALLKQIEEDFQATTNKQLRDVTMWACRFESKHMTSKTDDIIARKAFMIAKGVQLATDISTWVKTVFSLHVCLETPLTTKRVLMLAQSIELVKSIQLTFHRKSAEIGNLMSIMCEYISFTLQRVLTPFKRKLKENLTRLDETQVDQLSAIELMQRVLYGAPNRSSIVVLKVALHLVTSKTGGIARPEDFDAMRVYLRKLELVSTWQASLQEACDCSYLYWQRIIIPVYFKNVYNNPTKAGTFPFMFAALHDPCHVLLCAHHTKDKRELFNAYRKEVSAAFLEEIVQPLSREIETTLRLSTHSVVLEQGKHSLGDKPHKDFTHLLNAPTVRWFGTGYNIRDSVQDYLERQFYNLTALHPEDWKTYEEMRALAKERYAMTLNESYLPGQILDQGLDILEITRSIHHFVNRHVYNMNSQLFIEKTKVSESKHIHTVHIRHIVNSIRTHGTGMTNTTVNFVFRLLKKKFYTFSQFLFDELVKSRLLKDIKWFAENREANYNLYPMKRADKFVKEIRRLGVDQEDQSTLDHFRKLITEIGNGLAYVRMVRTGGMQAISGYINFVPNLDDIPCFESMLSDANFRANPEDSDEEVDGEIPETTHQAARNLDSIVKNQERKFGGSSEDSDYFKLLESVFKADLMSEQNKHLQLFHIIVPPLTVSYLEHMISMKDGLNKKGRDCCITDDGFALGVSFILKVLNLIPKFESLHWFQSVKTHYKEEKQKVEQMVATANATAKTKKERNIATGEQQGELSTLNLSSTRIAQRMAEFKLMEYAFSSAKVFFKDKKQVKEDDDEDEEDEEDEESLDEAPGAKALGY